MGGGVVVEECGGASGGGGAAGLWLKRGAAGSLPATAWILLAIAALAVNTASTRGLAGWLYPAGVSLYSTALVAWPGWFSGVAGVRPAAWRAAWLFAIAGWFGSANGIGMAQTLNTVPPVFIAVAGLVVIGVMVLQNGGTGGPARRSAVVALSALAFKGREIRRGVLGCGAWQAGLCFRRLHQLPLAISEAGFA